jgi:hypothetical protein
VRGVHTSAGTIVPHAMKCHDPHDMSTVREVRGVERSRNEEQFDLPFCRLERFDTCLYHFYSLIVSGQRTQLCLCAVAFQEVDIRRSDAVPARLVAFNCLTRDAE